MYAREVVISLRQDPYYNQRLAIIKGHPLDTTIDWQQLGPYVIHHDLSARAYRMIRQFNLPVNSTWKQKLKVQAQKQIISSQRYIATLLKLSPIFESKHIKWIVLKGLPLAKRHYPHPSDRSFSDLDLVFPEEQRTQVIDLMTELGFVIGKDIKLLENQHKVVFVCDDPRLLPVEAHFGFGTYPIDGRQAFASRQAFQLEFHEGCITTWVLPLNMEIDYLAFHACVQHRMSHLKWMVDFWEISQKNISAIPKQHSHRQLNKSYQLISLLNTEQNSKAPKLPLIIMRWILDGPLAPSTMQVFLLRCFFSSPLSVIHYQLRKLKGKYFG